MQTQTSLGLHCLLEYACQNNLGKYHVFIVFPRFSVDPSTHKTFVSTKSTSTCRILRVHMVISGPRHAKTSSTICGQRRPRSAFAIRKHNHWILKKMLQYRANALMKHNACESAHFAHVRRNVFAGRCPSITVEQERRTTVSSTNSNANNEDPDSYASPDSFHCCFRL